MDFGMMQETAQIPGKNAKNGDEADCAGRFRNSPVRFSQTRRQSPVMDVGQMARVASGSTSAAVLVQGVGLEPTTTRLEGGDSIQLSYPCRQEKRKRGPRMEQEGGPAKRFGPCYRVHSKTGCWNWLRTINGEGYGTFRNGGKTVLAHRFYYRKHKGEIPARLELDHTCRNPRCVNPDHLEPVTHAENVRRGRRAKLSKAQVAFIKSLKGISRGYDIADHFGVSKSLISHIWTGRIWKEIPAARGAA